MASVNKGICQSVTQVGASPSPHPVADFAGPSLRVRRCQQQSRVPPLRCHQRTPCRRVWPVQQPGRLQGASGGQGRIRATGDKLQQGPPQEVSTEEAEVIQAVELVQVEETEERGELVFAYLAAAVAFGLGIWGVLGPEKAEEYFAGYLLEQSLSVDNLFVFILVFQYFRTPRLEQDKVLTFGILSAAVLRLIMIVLGVELIDRFQPVLLLFAGILLASSYKLLASGGGEEEEEDLNDNAIVKLCRRFIQVTDAYDGDKFFTVQNGERMATPLLLVLAVIEISDVVFAVDSIPAVFGVTKDPFIVYTSNIAAIVSLRALYSFVSTVMSELRYLDKAVAVVLGFIGGKMVVEFFGWHISTTLSLEVVAVALATGVAASLWLPPQDDAL
ncbi:hypothetical protein WJX72_004869 [[Myrmecia] bisecta]|uniref:Integral membrane protein TerC n=1 Tax=[Myrmecia] bisecta TaxID=41462 RepID=A0AAW1P9P4_9CHLO